MAREDLPLRIQKGIPVFAAAVIEIATTFGQAAISTSKEETMRTA